jgi:hypothetical protein
LQNSNKKPKKKQKKLTYSEIEHIVEYLVKVKSDKYKFDYYDTDDIGQEIRIICLKVLGHFDFEKVKEDKWVNFFGRCVDNALKNLKRDKYIRFASTCSKDCLLLHENDDDMSKVCKKWVNHQANNEKKKKIKHPVSLEIVGDVMYNYFENSIMADDIKRYLIDNIEDNLRPTLVQLINGSRTKLSKKKIEKVQTSVKELLEG